MKTDRPKEGTATHHSFVVITIIVITVIMILLGNI